MIKWFRRLIVYPVTLLLLIIVIFLFYNQDLYYTLKGFYGSQIQWFGYEEKGNGIIEKALNVNKNVTAETYHGYSVQNTKNGNYDEAIRYLNMAALQNPKEVDGYFGWCLLYYYRDYDKALFHLNRLDSSTTFIDYVGDDNILYAKGLCYKQKGNYIKALELFQLAIDYEFKEHGKKWINHQMYFQTGRTLQLLEKNLEAIEYYNLAIESWDGSSESIYYKGLAEIELGRESGCKNLNLALEKVKKGIKSSDSYVKQFDEIYVGEVEEMIRVKCEK
jgi:tetratricopeptide (TPR) repeat protein